MLAEAIQVPLAPDAGGIDPKRHGRARIVGMQDIPPSGGPGSANGVDEPPGMGAFRAARVRDSRGELSASSQEVPKDPVDEGSGARLLEVPGEGDAGRDRRVRTDPRVDQLVETDEQGDLDIGVLGRESPPQQNGEHVRERASPAQHTEADLLGQRVVAPVGERGTSLEAACQRAALAQYLSENLQGGGPGAESRFSVHGPVRQVPLDSLQAIRAMGQSPSRVPGARRCDLAYSPTGMRLPPSS